MASFALKFSATLSKLQDPKLADTIFRVGNEGNTKDFLVVGAVFAAQTPVFFAQLFGFFQEAKPSIPLETYNNLVVSKKKFVRIEDVSPEAFQFLVDEFHGRQPPLSSEIVSSVAYGAKWFDRRKKIGLAINFGQGRFAYKFRLRQSIATA